MNAKEAQSFFSDALGPDAAIQSPDSTRPYIKVGTKGEAILYANFDLGAACGHKKVQGKTMHIPAVGVWARFFQKGGDAETFTTTPPLKVRAFGPKGSGVIRLSKHVFAICPMFGAQIQASWDAQEVTSQLVDWLKGLIQANGATPVPDAILREVIKQALNSIPPPEAGAFFSLEAMDHKDVADESDETQAAAAEPAAPADPETPPKKGPQFLN